MMDTGTFKCTKCGECVPREFVNLHICKENKKSNIFMDHIEALLEESIDQALKHSTP